MVKFIINVSEEAIENFASADETKTSKGASGDAIFDKMTSNVIKHEVIDKNFNGGEVVLDRLFADGCDDRYKPIQRKVLRYLLMASFIVIADAKEEEERENEQS